MSWEREASNLPVHRRPSLRLRAIPAASISRDSGPVWAYTPRVESADTTVSAGGGANRPTRIRRRRPPSQDEQQRREAWGREWSNVGKAWKRQHANEGR